MVQTRDRAHTEGVAGRVAREDPAVQGHRGGDLVQLQVGQRAFQEGVEFPTQASRVPVDNTPTVLAGIPKGEHLEPHLLGEETPHVTL